MVTKSSLQYLLSDTESLTEYVNGKFPSMADIKRRMLLKAREQNKFIPDHYYRLQQENTFNSILSLPDLMSDGLKNIAFEHLTMEGRRIYVKSDMQNSWQELITFIPPLLLQSVFLHHRIRQKTLPEKIHSYYRDYIFHNTRHTALPSPKQAQLDYLVKQRSGLHDLHMHLNGAMETDLIWQDYLTKPRAIYHDLVKAYESEQVKEQLEQESSLFSPLSYVRLLKVAQKLRRYFYSYLFSSANHERYFSKDKNQLLQKILDDSITFPGYHRHPFLPLVSEKSDYPFLMSLEALMYTLLLQKIAEQTNEVLSSLFHFYLLILGLTNRLLVQQLHQNGFEQFQKHTLNRLREESEKKYLKRYLQMAGNDSTHLRFLEGRFSPKKTSYEMVYLFGNITSGWNQMKKHIEEYKELKSPKDDTPELNLVAHFIKQRDYKPDILIRHKKLRYETWHKARILSLLLKQFPTFRKQMVAVDAAASEFDTPPEVFAPVFRLMRRVGIKHFTYHAGEDFYHIVGGLRAIYEAIIFCGLQPGDRIGHATATGLSAHLWSKTLGEKIMVRKGHYMDDLVFAYHIIIQNKVVDLNRLLPFIINKIQNFCFEIYKKHYSVSKLEEAWLMRKCCPIHTLNRNKKSAELISVFSDYEWNYIYESEIANSEKELKNNEIWQIFYSYHSKHLSEDYNQVITVNPLEVFTIQDLEKLQLALLSEMSKREIVIETLPTSNVRIGFHRDFSTYHLKNWVKWHEEGKAIPPIVVGSDDTGIFATNIYNEYANIYCSLINDGQLSQTQVMNVIKELDENSHIYRFH